MENYKYTCNYCSKEYVPSRRRIQKYCSTTCRVKAFYFRQKHSQVATKKKDNNGLSKPKEKVQNQKTSIEKLSLPGVGNAAIANVATDVLKNLLTREDNKPATKGDLKALVASLKERYVKVNGIPPRADGSQAFFDNVEKKIVYFKMKPWNL